MIDTQDQHTDVARAKLAGHFNSSDAGASTVSTVWNQKVAGFTLHTFSEDYTSLTTEYVSYQGVTVHSFTVAKGAPPSPTPTPACDVHAYPCEPGCTYIRKDDATTCDVATYGCYDCSKLSPGCPECPPSPTPTPACDVHTYPCEPGCTYIRKDDATTCDVATYGCYDCSKLSPGCPGCQ